MGPEVIKAKHLPVGIVLGVVGYVLARWLANPVSDEINQLNQAITYPGVFFLVALPAVALQYAENRLVWSRFFDLADNLSFFGLSLGLAVGLIGFVLW
jgi:membrane protease YdiL (CAAX protease family)